MSKSCCQILLAADIELSHVSTPVLHSNVPLHTHLHACMPDYCDDVPCFFSGVQHFNGDNFNEMSPSSTDASYLSGWGEAMYTPLSDVAGDGASWFVQGWSLGRWPDSQLSAYWSKVPPGKLLNLDLYVPYIVL